jgi:hypothetical protein
MPRCDKSRRAGISSDGRPGTFFPDERAGAMETGLAPFPRRQDI